MEAMHDEKVKSSDAESPTRVDVMISMSTREDLDEPWLIRWEMACPRHSRFELMFMPIATMASLSSSQACSVGTSVDFLLTE
eukprot:7387341-Prymnesium_polylepis.1